MIVTFPFSTRDGGEISTRDLQKIVQALPQYSDQVEKLTLHIEVDYCSQRISALYAFCSDVYSFSLQVITYHFLYL